ncbi:rho family-interacting cell polarization regulator 2-like [Ciona intestinalis]
MANLGRKKHSGQKKLNGGIQFDEMYPPSGNIFHSPSHDFSVRKKLSKKKSKPGVSDKQLDLYNKIEISGPTPTSPTQDSATRATLPSTSTDPESPNANPRHNQDARPCSELEEIADSAFSGQVKNAKSFPNKYGSEASSQASSQALSNSNSIDENYAIPHSTSAPFMVPSQRSPPLACVSTLPPHSSLTRSFSVSLRSNGEQSSRRKRSGLFTRRSNTLTSASTSSLRSSSTSSMMEVKTPSPSRFLTMYHAVRKGISEHVSVNTAELNVLQVKQRETGNFNAAQSYGADKQIKHLERVIKKLQYLQTQIDEIHEAYTLQQRYREGAFKLKSAIGSSRVSSRSSMMGIKSDLNRCSETLCTLEQELTALLGRFHIEMKGLLGFARLRSGDHYEVIIRYGNQKWKMRGSVKSAFDQTWDSMEKSMQPLLSDLINIKVTEVKILGKHSLVGNVSCETKDLFKVDPQNLLVDLNDLATLKLSLQITWSPFDGYEMTPSGGSSFASNSRLRSKSVIERPSSSLASPRNRLSTAFTRPMSVIYQSSANSNSNNNHRPITSQNSLNGPIRISEPLKHYPIAEDSSSTDENRNKKSNHADNDDVFPHSKEEEAFLAAISRNVKRTLEGNVETPVSPPVPQPEVIITVKKQEEVKTDGFQVVSSDEEESKSDADKPIYTTGKLIADEALIPHLELVGYLLKDLGHFGPLKVKEILALDKLNRQCDVIERLLDIGTSDDDVIIEEFEELEERRDLFEMWRSCCDGRTALCVSVRTLRLELKSEHGREVRTKHTDVVDIVFPELVKRIFGRPDLSDIETKTVTLFHVIDYVNESSDSVHEDFGKLVDKLALEMFITTTLSSSNRDLVLVAIKRLSSLLALRLSNLRALSHLVLDGDTMIRSAAAAHIKHIATEEPMKEKALVSYAELLESPQKRDRQCACIALGFMKEKKCIPQMAYLFTCDPEKEVREAASTVLLSLGEEGEKARETASSTLLMQTMTQQVSISNPARMGTAL